MKRLTATVVALVLAVATAAHSAAPDQTTPGTPGTPNCKGQTLAFIAQAAKNGFVPDEFRGIGGVSRLTDLSNQEIMALVDAFCRR